MKPRQYGQVRMLTAAALILVVTQCAQAQTGFKKPTTVSRDEKVLFADFLENYYQEGLTLFPMNATFIGDRRYNGLLHNDITREHRARVKAYFTYYLKTLGRYDRAELTEEDKTSYDILKWECEMDPSTPGI